MGEIGRSVWKARIVEVMLRAKEPLYMREVAFMLRIRKLRSPREKKLYKIVNTTFQRMKAQGYFDEFKSPFSHNKYSVKQEFINKLQK